MDDAEPLTLGPLLGLWLPPAVVADGAVTGGVIRRAHSILLAADYVQTATPVDEAVHPGVRVHWHAVLEDPGVGFGPLYGVGGDGWFGPPGVFDVKGLVEIGADQSLFTFTPIAYANVLRVRNVPGVDRVVTPAWRFMEASILFADAATVTLQKNDINGGGAAFVDSQFLATANGGVLDGVTNDVGITSLLSAPVVLGHTHVPFRHAVDVFDSNTYLGQPGSDAFEAFVHSHGLVPGADGAGGGTIDRQVGVRIRRLSNAAVNVGIDNESATVERLVEVVLTSPGAEIPVDATAVAVRVADAGDDGPHALGRGEDGQRLTVLNIGDEPLRLATPMVALRGGEAALVVWSDALGSWVEVGTGRPGARPEAALVRPGAFAFPASTARTTTRLVPDRPEAVPLAIGRPLDVARLAVEVVDGASPGATVRLAIHANAVDQDAPGERLHVSTPIAVDGAAGVLTGDVEGLQLDPGLVWLVVTTDAPGMVVRGFTGGRAVADGSFGPDAAQGYWLASADAGTPGGTVTVGPLIGIAPR